MCTHVSFHHDMSLSRWNGWPPWGGQHIWEGPLRDLNNWQFIIYKLQKGMLSFNRRIFYSPKMFLARDDGQWFEVCLQVYNRTAAHRPADSSWVVWSISPPIIYLNVLFYFLDTYPFLLSTWWFKEIHKNWKGVTLQEEMKRKKILWISLRCTGSKVELQGGFQFSVVGIYIEESKTF